MVTVNKHIIDIIDAKDERGPVNPKTPLRESNLYAVIPFETNPGDLALRKLETNEKMRVVQLMAINYFPAHGTFFVHRSNLGPFPRMPKARGLDTHAMRTEIIGIRFFVLFWTLTV